MSYEVAKWLHILSSTVLFGTGLGSAYYMFFASLSGDARTVAHVVRYVVIADWLFTTTTRRTTFATVFASPARLVKNM